MQTVDRGSVLVLGATGIIGKYVCAAAANSGYRVVAVSRGQKAGLEIHGVESVTLDVRDPTAVSRRLDGAQFDAVVDLVSFTPSQVEQTFEVLGATTRQYVFVSSATVSAAAPSNGVITEESPLVNAGWNYPILKAESEARLHELGKSRGHDYTIVRPYITYSEQRIAFGLWEGDQVLGRLQRGLPILLVDEIASARTSLTHAYDFAAGLVALIGQPDALNETFQIASPEQITWKEVFEFSARTLGLDIDLQIIAKGEFLKAWPGLAGKVEDRAMDRAFSADKLSRVVNGFDFQVGVEQGYTRVLDSWSIDQGLGFSPANLGRYERMLSELGRNQGTSWRPKSYDLQGKRDKLEYVVGRHRAADASWQMVRSIRDRNRPAGDYA